MSGTAITKADAGMLANYAPPAAVVPESKGGGAPYVGFVSSKSPNFASLITDLGGVKPEGTPYLGVNGKNVVLSPFRFLIFTGFRSWVSRDNTNKLTGVSFEQPTGKTALRDNVEAVIWVFSGDTVIPSVTSLRSAKADAATKGLIAVAEAGTASWGEKSPDHKASLIIPQPFARVTVTAHPYNDTAKSGFAFSGFRPTITPTSAGDFQILTKAMKDPQFQALHEAAMAEYNRRIAEQKAFK